MVSQVMIIYTPWAQNFTKKTLGLETHRKIMIENNVFVYMISSSISYGLNIF